ncbi:hypothetical protein CLOP_g452 [Closterium sp. NIES-67]|nr:hypothetical protein CLOP_g452 [Closterium sp. NIES-67]
MTVFRVLVKRGNKQQARELMVPSDSAIAVATRRKEEEEERERQDIKRRVLEYNDRAEDDRPFAPVPGAGVLGAGAAAGGGVGGPGGGVQPIVLVRARDQQGGHGGGVERERERERERPGRNNLGVVDGSLSDFSSNSQARLNRRRR